MKIYTCDVCEVEKVSRNSKYSATDLPEGWTYILNYLKPKFILKCEKCKSN